MPESKHALKSIAIISSLGGVIACLIIFIYAYATDTHIPGETLGVGATTVISNLGNIWGRTKSKTSVRWSFKRK